MGLFLVTWVNNISGGSDSTYVLADNPTEAIEKAKVLLSRHKLVPDFLNAYGRWNVISL